MSSDPAQLVDAAETIASARLIRDNLDDAITTQDAKFLLDLDDPLGYVTDRWISETVRTTLTKRNFSTAYGRFNRILAKAKPLRLSEIS